MRMKAVVVAIVLVTMILSGCMGARGWPGVTAEGDTIYVGTMDGRVLSLNPESGSRNWQWEAEAEEAGNPFSCSNQGQFRAGMSYGLPVVANNTVYVGTYNGKVYAIGSESGSDVWSYDTGSPIAGGVAVAGDTLFVGTSDGELHAIDVVSGLSKQGFPFQTEDKIWSTPVVRDGVVYFGSVDHNLYAVDAVTGELRWDFETEGGIASTPLVVEDVVYFGSFDSKFYAVDAGTGEEKWVFEQAGNWFWSEALYKEGIVYACSLDHHVYAIDAVTGETAWPEPFDAGEQIKSSPVIVEDILVVASKVGKVYGIDLVTGEEKWHQFDYYDDGVTVLAPLCSFETEVYMNAQDNRLYTLDGITGRQSWSVSLVE
jgi:outer membrane protein assembly factor BamB